MATKEQSNYIRDLVVIKTKEFKEVKELLISNEIIGADADMVKNAQSIAEITNALDDGQASRLIDVLNATKTPARSTEYSKRRIETTVSVLDDITATIDDWDFNGLR
jgi:precorrin isomerase